MPDDRIAQELHAQKQSNSSSNRYIKLEKLVIMHILLQNLNHQQVSSMVTPRSIEGKPLRSLQSFRQNFGTLLQKQGRLYTTFDEDRLFVVTVADRLLNVACAMLKNRTLFNPLLAHRSPSPAICQGPNTIPSRQARFCVHLRQFLAHDAARCACHAARCVCDAARCANGPVRKDACLLFRQELEIDVFGEDVSHFYLPPVAQPLDL